MVRTATWSRIGTDVSEATNLNDVLEKSGLNFIVVKEPIKTESGIIIPNSVATVRADTNEPLGIVGKGYQICQNEEAFDFVNYIDEDIKFAKAGMTHGGLIYIIASLPKVDILGDEFEPYVIFQNGHNGGVSVRAAISPLRIVCQNQFNMAFKESESTVNIRHSLSMQSKLVSAREVLSSTADYMKRLNEEAEKYSKIKVSAAQGQKILEELFPIKDDMSDKNKEAIMSKRTAFMSAYREEDNLNFKGSAWALVNAYSDYLTHVVPTRMTKNWEENKFCAVTFSPSLMQLINIINNSRVAV